MANILVVSDIHANFSALQAVLNDAPAYDALWCLGDIVGYGPDPNECIQAIRSAAGSVCLLGNHDAAILGNIDIDTFNREASIAAVWTREQIQPENLAYLRQLPETLVTGDVTLVHGSPRNPVWEYLLDIYSAEDNFRHFDTTICLVGHTHIPLVYAQVEAQNRVRLLQFQSSQAYQVTSRVILNPGSVGQPRDYDPRAAYALFDTDNLTWECRRVPYDVSSVQERILAAGLPSRHAERLVSGW